MLSILLLHEEEDENDIIQINLFKRGYKTYTAIMVGLLYPVFLMSTLLGTVWYIEVIEFGQCFTSEDTMNWYFLTWIIAFYTTIIIMGTVISYSAIVHYRTYLFESQYSSLLEQYDEAERPEMEFTINGLPPDKIRNMQVIEVNEDDGKCAICLDTFVESMKARKLPCMHKYHLLCIDKWLMQHTSCPICKTDFNRL